MHNLTCGWTWKKTNKRNEINQNKKCKLFTVEYFFLLLFAVDSCLFHYGNHMDIRVRSHVLSCIFIWIKIKNVYICWSEGIQFARYAFLDCFCWHSFFLRTSYIFEQTINSFFSRSVVVIIVIYFAKSTILKCVFFLNWTIYCFRWAYNLDKTGLFCRISLWSIRIVQLAPCFVLFICST